MKYLIIFLLASVSTFAQEREYVKRFEHFSESRGDSENGRILTLPYQEIIRLHDNLNSNSGLGPTFNYYGTIVVVDQMQTLPNGDMQLVLRREDGKEFYGIKQTIKAVLSNKNSQQEASR